MAMVKKPSFMQDITTTYATNATNAKNVWGVSENLQPW